MAFAIKAEIGDPRAKTFTFTAQKTMYGGKHIAEGEPFSCSRARTRAGKASSRAALSRPPSDRKEARHRPANTAGERHHQTHRIRKAAAGAERARHFTDWNDRQPGTELNFKFYRQATNKIAGISDEAAAFLSEFF